MNIIEIKNLSHSFSDGTMGLDNVNLNIREGAFVVIAGRNGSGKTTLLRHLNGLLIPSAGIVRLAGVPVTDNLLRARQMVGMVFQEAESQVVGETVYDDVAFGPENLSLDRNEIKKRVSNTLKAVSLSSLADQRPHILSGGEKRRLAIAGILAMNPSIVVFDEPFSNLDYPGCKQLLEQILSLHKAGNTILVATHELEKIVSHADHLVIMEDGKVVRDGLPEEVVKGIEAFGVKEPLVSGW